MNLFTKITIIFCFLFYSTSGQDKIVPIKDPVIVRERELLTLTWRTDFPLQESWFFHVYFRRPDGDFGVLPIAILSNKKPTKNSAVPEFFNKISSVTVKNQQSNSFEFELAISDMGITEEGIYEVRRISISGSHRNIKSAITAGVIVKPNIVKDPLEVTKQENTDIQLKCKVSSGSPKPLFFKWYFKGENYLEKKALTDELRAMDTSYYNITKLSYNSAGEYICEVSNGFQEKDEYKVVLHILHKPYVKDPPSDVTMFESSSTSKEMNCFARGNPTEVTYRWYRQNVEIQTSTKNLIIENGGKRLRFVTPTRAMATKYSCSGENIYGQGDRKGADLVVTYIPEPVEFPNLVNKEASVNQGHNITIKCYSDAVPPATYSWFRRYKDFRGQVREEKLGEDNKSGELTLYNVRVNDTGEYKCLAFNFPDPNLPNSLHPKHDVMTLKVLYGPLMTNITANGLNQSNLIVEIEEDKPVTIECKSHSEPPALYSIQHKDTQLNSVDSIGSVTIKMMKIENEGDYICVARNKELTTTETRKIKVLVAIKPKPVQPFPKDDIFIEKSIIQMKCRFQGRPAPKVFWTKDGLNITKFGGVISKTYRDDLSTSSEKLFTVEAVLHFTGIRSTDEGKYACVAYNGAGRATAGVYYTVHYRPKFLSPLKNYTVKELTSDITFTCAVIAKPQISINYRWFFNSKETSHTESTYVVKIARKDNSGKYVCQASNSVGPTNSTVGTLLVTYKPKITFLTKNNQIADLSSTISLQCDVEGVPQPQVFWEKQGDLKFKVFGNQLSLQGIKVEDKGVYLCIAENKEGKDTGKVNVLVRHTPVISTSSPADTKIGVNQGSTVTLYCRAEAYPVPKIFWKEKNGNGNLVDGVGIYNIKEGQTEFDIHSRLTFIANEIGAEYVCNAANDLGNKEQLFSILAKGKPEPPIQILMPTDELQTDFPVVVNIKLSWVPGFGGGYPVEFILLYREKNGFTDQSYEQLVIGPAQENQYFFKNRRPSTTYEFAMESQNQLGKSVMSKPIEFKTSDPPPPVATVDFKMGSDGKSIVVSWLIIKDPVLKTNRKRRNVNPNALKWDYALIRYQVSSASSWKDKRIDNVTQNGTDVLENLNPSESYNVYFLLYDNHGNFAPPVGVSESIKMGEPKAAERKGLSQTDIIAIGVGCGGALLLLLVIVLFIIIHKRREDDKLGQNSRVQVDIPIDTMNSNDYNTGSKYRNYSESGPYDADSTIIDDASKSPPPEYNNLHHYADPPSRDYGDNLHRQENFNSPQDPMPSYTSFGRLPKKDRKDLNNYSQSMNQLDSGSRAAEISRGNEPKRRSNRYSLDNLDDYPESSGEPDANRPLLQNKHRPSNVRNSRGRLSSEEEPPSYQLRNPPSDEGALNRAPGAFGDRAQRLKKPTGKRTYDQPPPPPPNGFHQGVNGRESPTPSSIASSKPYRSDNEYIDDQDDKYVGFLV